jgi:hypothetical protein
LNDTDAREIVKKNLCATRGDRSNARQRSRLKLPRAYRILDAFRVSAAQLSTVQTKEKAMRKVLLLALVSMFFATACSKPEETAPAPDAAASAAAPAAMASDAGAAASSAVASDAASPAAATSPAAP